jgi:phosphatidylglycerophosphate synthase
MKKKTKYKLESVLKPLAFNVDPNAVTLFSVLVTTYAAYLIYSGQYFMAAIVFVIGALFDSLDGVIARRYRRTTDFGAFLDRCADRINDAIILIAVIFTGYVQPFIGVLTLAMVLFASYTSSTIEVIAKNRIGETMSLRPLRALVIFLSLILASDNPLYLESMFVLLLTIATFSVFERFRKASKFLSRKKRK